MPTRDGISDADWDGVKERAFDLIAHHGDNDEGILRDRLLNYLVRLQDKYGRKPSILAARADFTVDDVERERLLIEAFEIAENGEDDQAMLYVAHSMATLYVEDAWSQSKAAFWLKRLARLSKNKCEQWIAEDLTSLRNRFHSKRNATKS